MAPHHHNRRDHRGQLYGVGQLLSIELYLCAKAFFMYVFCLVLLARYIFLTNLHPTPPMATTRLLHGLLQDAA